MLAFLERLGTSRSICWQPGKVLAGGEIVQADYVVSAVPPHQLLPLLPAEWRKRAPFDLLKGFEPCPCIAVYLWFDRDLHTERFFAHLWSPQRLNYDFYDLSRIRHGWRGRPTIMASNIIYSHHAHGMSDAEIVHADVHRIPVAIPCPMPGFEGRRPGSSSPLPGLVRTDGEARDPEPPVRRPGRAGAQARGETAWGGAGAGVNAEAAA